MGKGRELDKFEKVKADNIIVSAAVSASVTRDPSVFRSDEKSVA